MILILAWSMASCQCWLDFIKVKILVDVIREKFEIQLRGAEIST